MNTPTIEYTVAITAARESTKVLLTNDHIREWSNDMGDGLTLAERQLSILAMQEVVRSLSRATQHLVRLGLSSG